MMHQIVDMFDPQKMAQNLLDMTKNYTETAVKTMKASSEIYEKSLDAMVKQGLVAQEEGQKMMAEWFKRVKEGQQQYWSTLEENLKKMESVINSVSGKKKGK